MPTSEELYQQQLNEDRAQYEQAQVEDRMRQEQAAQESNNQTKITGQNETVSFPWGMFFLALIFDLIGLIPIVNFISEAVAGLLFGLWQRAYSPKTDPILTFILAKIADVITAGILPSNIAVVIYAYLKKKASSKLKIAGSIAKATA